MTSNRAAHSPWLCYLVAILVVGVAAAARAAFLAELGRGTAYLTFYPAVMIAALYGGLSAGLLATVLSALLAFYWVQRGFMSPVEWLAMAVFFMSCTLVSYVCEAMHRAGARAKRNEEAQHLLSSIVEYSDDAIIGKSLDGTILTWNNGAARLYGYSAAEAIGRPISVLLPPHLADDFPQIMARLRRGERVEHFETERVAKDGRRLYVSLMVSPLKDTAGNVVGASAVSRDVTERKLADDRLAQLNADLQSRTAELQAANKELEAFSYSVSHDLRAPLRHVNGYVDLLRKHAAPTLDDKDRRYMDTIADSARQMGVLIDDLLTFSRLGRAELRMSSVSLDQLAREAVEGLSAETQGRQIAWKIGPLPDVHGDRAMLRQVLANLLDNAVKYTRTRQQAHIEIGANSGDGESVIFVKDNGVGFDMQYVDKLFGVFQRLHSADEFEGTGIGLASVRRIISRHGGRTWAEGTEDGGATFYFSLPAGKPGEDRGTGFQPVKDHGQDAHATRAAQRKESMA